MKTIIFFDVDNTIYNNTLSCIPDQTKKLLTELSKNEQVILGLATGRSLKKLGIIKDILPLFKYKVVMNGALVYHGEDVVFDEPIAMPDVLEVLKIAKEHNICVSMVGLDDEALNCKDTFVEKGLKQVRGLSPYVDAAFYESHLIYEFWLFSEDETKLHQMTERLPKFKLYPWFRIGADLVYAHIHKATGIKKALRNESDYRLICIGDGANDISMIEMADLGIVMDNTRDAKLKEKADHIAPHIKEDQLYDFFKSIHLI